MAEQHAVADFHAVADEVACLVVAHAGPWNGRARRRQRIVHRALVRLGLHQPVRGCDCEASTLKKSDDFTLAGEHEGASRAPSLSSERRLYIRLGTPGGPPAPPVVDPSR